MTPGRWIRVLMWTGIGLMLVAQAVSLTLQSVFFPPRGDIDVVLWWLIDLAQRYAAPIGAALFAGSFVVRALVPPSRRDVRDEMDVVPNAEG